MTLHPRETLPNRRPSEFFIFEHESVAYHATISRFPNGDIAELFLDAGKIGSAVNVMAHDAAVVFSIARQCGTPLELIRAGLSKLADGSCAGAIGRALELADEVRT
jgi:hypothetical protein